MLKRDRERRLYGVTRDQALADSTSSRVAPPANRQQLNEGAFAVTPRQAWRGSGFRPPRGRAHMDATTGSKATIQIGAIRETGSIMLVHNILILGEGQMHEAIRATISVATIISVEEVVDDKETTDL